MNSESLGLVIVTAALNAAVTWGIVKTQLAWLRRDVDSILKLRDALVANMLKMKEVE
ncbi:conserved protein of unknown function [Burkholderia multivorans]